MKIHKTAYLYVAFLAASAGVLFVNQAAITRQLDDWQLLPRPVRLSELYFTDERQLPSIVKVGSLQKLTFTVHNLEQQTTTYNYKIVAVSAGSGVEQLLGEGVLTLEHDHSQMADQTVVVPALGTRLAMKINLEYEGIAFGEKTPRLQSQSISYWTKVVEKLGINQGKAEHDS